MIAVSSTRDEMFFFLRGCCFIVQPSQLVFHYDNQIEACADKTERCCQQPPTKKHVN